MIGAIGFTTTADHRFEAGGATERAPADRLRLRLREGVRAVCEVPG